MNNFFLLHEALNPPTLLDFETGVKNLTVVFANKSNTGDTFLRHQDFWEAQTKHGYCYEVPSKLNGELIGLSVKLFNSFKPISNYIPSEHVFDSLFNNDCNGFTGFDFSETAIQEERRIVDLNSFNQFKQNCALETAYDSLKNFWDNRITLFPNLIFCDTVWDQILHLSINDDRFKLINDKLKRLDDFTKNWKVGIFEYDRCGLDCSPDTPTRIDATRTLRTFNCPGLGNMVFNFHVKWYYGKEPFRLYFHPETSNHKVYIGYIGNKSDIGF